MPASRSTSFNMRTFPTTAILMSVSALCSCAQSWDPYHRLQLCTSTCNDTWLQNTGYHLQINCCNCNLLYLNLQPSSSSISSPLDPATYSLGKESLVSTLHLHMTSLPSPLPCPPTQAFQVHFWWPSPCRFISEWYPHTVMFIDCSSGDYRISWPKGSYWIGRNSGVTDLECNSCKHAMQGTKGLLPRCCLVDYALGLQHRMLGQDIGRSKRSLAAK